jgi:hypothetical protein
MPNLKPKIVMPWMGLQAAFPRPGPGTRKIKFIYSEFFLLDGGFFLRENVFWRMLSALFLIN